MAEPVRVGQARRRDTVESGIIEALRRIGCRVIQHSGSGEPDLFVHWAGDWVALEVKAPKGKLTKAQSEDMRGVTVVRSTEDALWALGLLKAKPTQPASRIVAQRAPSRPTTRPHE
jgi:Holliday junction resolvase